MSTDPSPTRLIAFPELAAERGRLAFARCEPRPDDRAAGTGRPAVGRRRDHRRVRRDDRVGGARLVALARAQATSSAASTSRRPTGPALEQWYIGRRHIEDEAARPGRRRLAGSDLGAVLPRHRGRPARRDLPSAVHARPRARSPRTSTSISTTPTPAMSRRASPTRCSPRSARPGPARCARSSPPSRPSRTS